MAAVESAAAVASRFKDPAMIFDFIIQFILQQTGRENYLIPHAWKEIIFVCEGSWLCICQLWFG